MKGNRERSEREWDKLYEQAVVFAARYDIPDDDEESLVAQEPPQ